MAGSSFPLRGRRDFSRHFIIKVLIIPCTSGAGSRGGTHDRIKGGLRQFSADSTALLPLQAAKVLYCLHVAAVFCRQYSTFATPGSKSAVLSARCGSFLQTVQHFCCLEWQKCCTVCRKWHACADSTALLLPQNAKVLYCLHKIPKIPP